MPLKVSFLLICTILPDAHPLKTKLDSLFSREERVLETPETVKEAGFTTPTRRKWSKAIVSRHPQMKGYFFKMYTDDQVDIDEMSHFEKRIEGAKGLRCAIYAHGFQDRFTVPKKWLYQLPIPEEGKKNAILVVQDVHKVNHEQNLTYWKTKLSNVDLSAFLILIEEIGLIDCVHPFNVPLTKTGKLAFIDTEQHHMGPIPYETLLPYLSFEQQAIAQTRLY